MEETAVLLRETFGLNSYETSLYLTLIKKEMSAKEAANKSGVPLPRVYDTLRSLEQKGFVKESSGIYTAINPEVALRTRIKMLSISFEREQEKRRNAMKKILRELTSQYRNRAEKEEIVMLRGIASISSAFLEVLRECEDILLLVRKGMEAKAVFLSYLREVKEGKAIRMLVPEEISLNEEDVKTIIELGIKVRKCSGITMDTMIGDEKHVIIGVPTSDVQEPFAAIAVWVSSSAFASSVRRAAESIWREGKNLI